MADRKAVRRRNKTAQPEHGKVIRLADDDEAVVNARTRFPHLVRDPNPDEWALKSGEHNRKLGSHVAKKKWRGFPIFSLSLEERATCPRSCEAWNFCYGNHASQYRAYRYRHGPALEDELERELEILSVEPTTRRGFVVRLHALGDFYSVAYVERWSAWLKRFRSLRVFGYTAWPRESKIGAAVGRIVDQNWDRFAVRFSESSSAPRSAGILASDAPRPDPRQAVVCPVETGSTACCGTCALCWTSEKRIIFIEH